MDNGYGESSSKFIQFKKRFLFLHIYENQLLIKEACE